MKNLNLMRKATMFNLSVMVLFACLASLTWGVGWLWAGIGVMIAVAAFIIAAVASVIHDDR